MNTPQIRRYAKFAVWGLAFAVVCVAVGVAVRGADSGPTQYSQPYAQRADVQSYIGELVAENGFDREYLERLFAEARQRPDVIERISKPAEAVWTWARYKRHLVDEERIAGGLVFWDAHADTLQRAEAVYGVPPEIVVAILGIETRYGRITGQFPVLDALTTLGFDYPPRADFFRKELTELLLLAREESKDPLTLKGSYAGAMGYGQFIPSSYRHYAVDFDGDEQRDIWTNPEDAIGSIANYFHRHDWQGLNPAAVRVSVSGSRIDAVADRSLQLKYTVGQLRDLGVDTGELASDLAATIYRVEGEQGIEYWLALHDFYVITRYNRSHLYALAVDHIARATRARREASVSS